MGDTSETLCRDRCRNTNEVVICVLIQLVHICTIGGVIYRDLDLPGNDITMENVWSRRRCNMGKFKGLMWEIETDEVPFIYKWVWYAYRGNRRDSVVQIAPVVFQKLEHATHRNVRDLTFLWGGLHCEWFCFLNILLILVFDGN